MQSAATAYPVFYRTYSRKVNGVREHWDEVCLRTLKGLQSIGNLTEDQVRLIDEAQKSLKALTSGRWLWVGGTDWSNKPENYYGSYNCSSTNIVDWHSFGLMMGLAMQGCGTGAVLEPQYIEQLPVIVNRFEVTIKGNVGDKPADQRLQQTRTTIDYPWNDVLIEVGDSREGWVKSYEDFLKLSSDAKFDPEYVVHVTVDLSNVRPSGEALKGFGGVANPVKVESLYTRCAEILSKAVGRKLNSVECCLLIDEAALVVVAGNIRRCLPKGSLVHTQSGLVPIEKVRIGDMVLTSKGFYPVTDFFDQGEQALCRIETVEGHVLECTKDHKIAVMLSGEHYRMDKAEDLLDVDFLLGLDATTNELKPVAIKSIEYDVRTDHTFDIEVSTVHEFVCNGLLVSNSAGMRQFSENDTLGMTAKDNLWQQNAVTGKWQIDPERDALRMANHTRVFHHKPSLDECIASVTKQYFSGEGAIQYAPEAVARANADLLPIDSDAKTQFLKAYEDGIEAAKKWLVSQFPSLTERELEHRFQRYGLNPCLTADTWIHTEHGARQIRDLIGTQVGVYVNGELFSTTVDGFFFTGNKHVVKMQTKEGFSLRLTENHQLLKVTAQTQRAQYTEWIEAKNLKVGDRILIHDHRNIQPWSGIGNFEEGWLIGNLIGDGSLYHTQWNDSACLRYWGQTKEEMASYAVKTLESATNYKSQNPTGHYHRQLQHQVINSSGLASLAAKFGVFPQNKAVSVEIEKSSYAFYCGFLRGFFDADGSVQGSQEKGVSVRLAQSNLESLKTVQRMLARLGIISSIYQQRRTAGFRMLPNSDRNMSPYACKDQHELVIAKDNLQYFADLIGFQDPLKSSRLNESLNSYSRKMNRERFSVTISSIEDDGIEAVYDCTVPQVSQFDANGIVAHNCGEIIGSNFFCNLAEIHLNQISPTDFVDQEKAFMAGALSVSVLLNHQFVDQRYKESREADPIVGVSITGLFDFFVNAFGVNWLQWWADGRCDWYLIWSEFVAICPDNQILTQFDIDLESYRCMIDDRVFYSCSQLYRDLERHYLSYWRMITFETVAGYCEHHGLKTPSRCTTGQPAGTKSLLTGASPGWHPPKAQRFIRRITFRKNDPVALACIDYGYNVIPSQSDKDENGHLLDDPFDPRCTEWLVEIPVEVPWANLDGADKIDISRFSALAQFDFYMQVQKYYTSHNTSSTIELRQHEIEALAKRIYNAIQNDEGYISSALLARFDDLQTFPRLPFEPIDKRTYDRLFAEMLLRRKELDFHEALMKYDDGGNIVEAGPAGCDSDKCLISGSK